MADIELPGISFRPDQSTGTPFSVEVAVENNETVAPLWGADALCSAGVTAPDGHRVEVTLEVRDESGTVVWEGTEEVCATVEQPSNVGGQTTASFTPTINQTGSFSVRADARALHVGGEASAGPKSLTVENGTSGLPAGDEGNSSDFNFGGWTPDGGSSSGANAFGFDLFGGSSTLPVIGVLFVLVVVLAVVS